MVKITPQIDEAYARKHIRERMRNEDPCQRDVDGTMDVMQRYENDRWWEKPDISPLELVTRQIDEIMIIPFREYAEALSTVIGIDLTDLQVVFMSKERLQRYLSHPPSNRIN
ncbi:MAG: hypothetical protein AABX23_01770 [Nanoarchaeota archaeon]